MCSFILTHFLKQNLNKLWLQIKSAPYHLKFTHASTGESTVAETLYVMSNVAVDGSVTFLHTEHFNHLKLQGYKIQRLRWLLLNTAFVFLQPFLGRVWSFRMFGVIIMLRDPAATKRWPVFWDEYLTNGSTMSLICLNLI